MPHCDIGRCALLIGFDTDLANYEGLAKSRATARTRGRGYVEHAHDVDRNADRLLDIYSRL